MRKDQRAWMRGWMQAVIIYMGKEETSLPMVMTESLMLSCIIDAKEHWDVATADIPGAFMQADVEGTVHMHLDGVMAEMLLKIDLALYRKYMVQDGKQPGQ